MNADSFASLFVTGAQAVTGAVSTAVQPEVAKIQAGIDEAKQAAKAALIMQAVSTAAVVVMAYCALRGCGVIKR